MVISQNLLLQELHPGFLVEARLQRGHILFHTGLRKVKTIHCGSTSIQEIRLLDLILSNETLVEYWIPTQDKFFGLCQSSNQTCGIANVLQFTVGHNNQIWFTEWSENKIGRIDAQKQLPFSVYTPTKEVTIKKGESAEIKVNVTSSSNQDLNINMISSGTFTPTGNLGNSTGSFSEESFLLNAKMSKQVSFIFTPSSDMQSGIYTLMIGGENNARIISKSSED